MKSRNTALPRKDDKETYPPVKPFDPTTGRVKSGAVMLWALTVATTVNADSVRRTIISLERVFVKVTARLVSPEYEENSCGHRSPAVQILPHKNTNLIA